MILASLRRLMYDTRALLFPRKVKTKTQVSYIPGLPDGINLFDLNEISLEFFGAPVTGTAYQHLSGWKTSGAYRIMLDSPDGLKRSLIYKVASYTMEDIPALEQLPIHPGHPEFVLYSQPPAALEAFLPQVYRADEVIPQQQYRYLLEDLQGNYRLAKGEKDMITASRLLPRLHLALRQWAAQADVSSLPQYNLDTSQGIYAYAYYHLDRYAVREADPAVRGLLDRWKQIGEIYLRKEFFTNNRRQLVHGDSNFSNIHLSNIDPKRMKLVDWEWAGFGLPEADMAALLKGVNNFVEQEAMDAYRKEIPYNYLSEQGNKVDYWHYYHWCQIERGLLDAAFLAAQCLGSSSQAKFNLSKAVHNAAQRTLAAHYHLTR